jgi:hypothetical protein
MMTTTTKIRRSRTKIVTKHCGNDDGFATTPHAVYEDGDRDCASGCDCAIGSETSSRYSFHYYCD